MPAGDRPRGRHPRSVGRHAPDQLTPSRDGRVSLGGGKGPMGAPGLEAPGRLQCPMKARGTCALSNQSLQLFWN